MWAEHSIELDKQHKLLKDALNQERFEDALDISLKLVCSALELQEYAFSHYRKSNSNFIIEPDAFSIDTAKAMRKIVLGKQE